MNPQTEYVTLSVSDGTSMRAYVARPQGTPRAGLIVFQEAFGVNAHIRDVTERFAREGYLAISPELFHRSAPGFEGSYSDFPAVMPHLQKLTDAGITADTRATFDWLQTSSKGRIFRPARSAIAWAGAALVWRLSRCPWAAGSPTTAAGSDPVRCFPVWWIA